ncbi:MAG: lipooligosaccharide transport system permease protein [Thermoleophilaceae bacterium]|jgi:lipooligosaccharide transport system permease protein|nr:lipooligosaccharide transport system permease protein [Thermoleophilaceae bacterium]MEA2623489.1 lipooligosaccharide transport system permease protein [Chloroflexota bacterium]
MTAVAEPLARSPVRRPPPGPAKGALRVLEHHIMVYRRTFRGTLFTTFLSPVLFLVAMGFGLGGLVDRNAQALDGVPYLLFLAPGLLAATAMQAAAGESMYPVMVGIVWLKTYHAMVAAPLRIVDIVIGQTLWVTLRLAITCAVFVLVMIVFGATDLAHGLVMLPLGVLTGLAFAAPIAAYSARQRGDSKFAAINRFLITPLFILSGVFFPLSQLPWFIQPIAWATPLWHGMELVRGVQMDRLDLSSVVVHLGVLFAWIVVGVVAGAVTFRKALIK